jgi:dihydroorotase
MVARARYDGAPVTADTAIPYLFLTDLDAGDFNPNYHLMPPLRTQADRYGLRTGLAESDLSALCSDHQPHEPDAKLAPFPATEPGISSLDSLLPLALRLVDENCLSLPDLVARLTSGPAAILNIPYGHLSQGATADICIFDPRETWTLNQDTMLSRGKNTPFLGWEMTGRVRYTLRDGKIIYAAPDNA